MLLETLSYYILVILFFAVFLGIPLCITILNIRGLIKKQDPVPIVWEIPLLIGLILSCVLYGSLPDYPVSVDRVDMFLIAFHTPLASWHFPTLISFFIISIVCFMLSRSGKALPPLPTALCISSMLIVSILAVAYIIQLSGNIKHFINDLPIIVSLFYPINIILLYARVIRHKANEMALKMNANPPHYSNSILKACANMLCAASGWLFVSFLLMLPLFCVIMIILVLCGQRPDAIIKVFTDTSEWSLSQQISPPDIDHTGHYLCTVAAQGHPRLVRPARYGHRHGKRILVNRQLCVANAFEQAIAEKFPKLHKRVRHMYDTYGYPLSRCITTKYRADFVYLVMKPIEYIFLLFLYSIDANPENRIASQYLPY